MSQDARTHTHTHTPPPPPPPHTQTGTWHLARIELSKFPTQFNYLVLNLVATIILCWKVRAVLFQGRIATSHRCPHVAIKSIIALIACLFHSAGSRHESSNAAQIDSLFPVHTCTVYTCTNSEALNRAVW